jgi:hypothetical protein
VLALLLVIGQLLNQVELVMHVVTRVRFPTGDAEAAADQVGPVLDLLELALDDADQAVQVSGGEVGKACLSSDHMPEIEATNALSSEIETALASRAQAHATLAVAAATDRPGSADGRVTRHRRAICASRGSAPGRPRGRAGPVSAPASRARRHSITWLEHSPSRRRTAPALPTRRRRIVLDHHIQLVLRSETPPTGLLGHLRIRALLLTGHPSSIAGHQHTVRRGHGHLRDISIPALGVFSGY